MWLSACQQMCELCFKTNIWQMPVYHQLLLVWLYCTAVSDVLFISSVRYVIVTWSEISAVLNLFYFLHIIYIAFHSKSLECTKTSIIHYSVDSCQRKDRKVRSGEGSSVGRREMLPVESKLVSHVRWVTHGAKSFLFFLQKDRILYLLNIVIFKGGL